MRRALLLSLMVAGLACGGDGDDDPDPDDDAPLEARAIDAVLTESAQAGVPVLAELEAVVPFLGNPGAPGSEGTTFTPTGAPNTYAFVAPLDRDGDGTPDVSVSGTVAFTTDPFTGTDTFGGTVNFTATGATGRTLSGAFTFSDSPSGRQVHGSAEVGGSTVSGLGATITIPAGSPITIRRATGSGSTQPNVCGYSLSGDANVRVAGVTGALDFTWRFSGSSRTVAVVNRAFTPAGGTSTDLADKTLTLPCGDDDASIDDWEGVWSQRWVCLPPEWGTAELTITVLDATTVRVDDEDPPGSGDVNSFEAEVLPGNPHVLTGFFIGGPPGNTYREDFTWTMSNDGQRVSKNSRYAFREGPNVGRGGPCGGRSEKQ
ncbi:MAG: hypothetical protein MUC69_07975 [Gemmatimonadales bacterium]|jgi:hypothetical protein|nr:hypothetical protein [Gemmatimonadales bacterium]